MKKLLLVLALFAASAAGAQEKGFYAGVHIGQAEAKDTCDGISGPTVSCDEKDTSWKILGGYQFTRHFAAELGYSDLGEITASGPGGTASVEATAFELVGVGMFPIVDRFSVYGKLGLYRGETDANVNTVLLTTSSSESNTDITFGFGVRYDFGARFGVRAEWQRYQDVGGGDIGEDDIDVLSIGLLLRF
jgi:OOP family OmpA-OmpF porin